MPLSAGLVAHALAPPLMLCCEVLSLPPAKLLNTSLSFAVLALPCCGTASSSVQIMPLGLTTVCLKASHVMRMQVRMRTIMIGSSSCSADMRWEAELDSCTRMLYEAELADGNTCTPTLTLFFEDQAFAKLVLIMMHESGGRAPGSSSL